MKYSIDEQLLQAIINYLASKPYGEVYQLIDAIQQAKPIEEMNSQENIVD